MVMEGTGDDGEVITIRESDGWIVAHHESTGVTSQGKSRRAALENLGEALELYHEDVPEGEDVVEPSSAPWM